MPPNRLRTLLAAAAGPPPADGLTDADLLSRFTDAHDAAAFEALVWRHGPLVRAACRHVLGQSPDADDAFQATFLVLARQAAAIRNQQAIGGWLYTIAGRVARKLRRQLSRQPTSVEDLTMTAAPDPPSPADDLREVLDEEIARLPAKYRLVVQYCYAAGHSTATAARHLGLPRGTVLTRLAWARRRLRDRLIRRGVTLGLGTLASTLGSSANALDPQLVRATVRAAVALAAGPAIASTASGPTLHLCDGVIRDMAISKLKLMMGAVLVAVAAAGIGVGRLAAPAAAGGLAAEDNPPRVSKSEPSQQPVPELPRIEPLPAIREPENSKYAEAIKKIERLEKELEQLRAEAKRTVPDIPPVPMNLTPPVVTPDPLTNQPPSSPPPAPTSEFPRQLISPYVNENPSGSTKQYMATRPVGSWHRSSGDHRFSLKFDGDRLIATNVVTTKNGPTTVIIEADYSITRDGVLFGYITGIDYPEGAANLGGYEDTTFSFRFRSDQGVLTIKEVKLNAKPADDAMLFVAGRYTDKPTPAKPVADPRPPVVGPAAPTIDVPVPALPRPTTDPLPASPLPAKNNSAEPGGVTPPMIPPPPTSPERPANDPFRRPDGSSRLLGPGQPSASPSVILPDPISTRN